jgi:hypothetical protein
VSGLHRGLIVALIVSVVVWLLVVWLVAEPTIDAVTVKTVPSQEHAAHVRTAQVASLWQDLHTQAVIDEYLREHHRAELAARERQKARRAAQQARRTSSGLPAVLHAIARCESVNGRYTYRDHGHANSTASGKYGFLDGTWRAWRGEAGKPYARAYLAPEWVQDQAAVRLYNAQGTRPWNASRSCWSRA